MTVPISPAGGTGARLESDDGVALPEASGRSTDRLLNVRNLTTQFYTRHGLVHAVEDVSFDLARGETLGIVGESGCGKTATALSIGRLIPNPPGKIVSGEIRLEGTDIMTLSDEEMRWVRGQKFGFIFQEPRSSLNPTVTIGDQISEAPRLHLGLSRRAARDRAIELLARAGIPRPRERLDDYPHQFSGGMCQRVMIAIALACSPIVLLADEPTTALDVTIQAQILTLLSSISQEFGMAVILITHDMGIAAAICDRVNVMYAGRIVETGAVDDVFERPQMPYTRGLLESLPRLDEPRQDELRTIEGVPPDLLAPSDHCSFAPRCPHARDVCLHQVPSLTARGTIRHAARCLGTEPEGWIA